MQTQLFSLKDFRAGKAEPLEWLKATKTKKLEEMALKVTNDTDLSSKAVCETFEHLDGLREIFRNFSEIENFLEEFTKSVAGDLLYRLNQEPE